MQLGYLSKMAKSKIEIATNILFWLLTSWNRYRKWSGKCPNKQKCQYHHQSPGYNRAVLYTFLQQPSEYLKTK